MKREDFFKRVLPAICKECGIGIFEEKDFKPDDIDPDGVLVAEKFKLDIDHYIVLYLRDSQPALLEISYFRNLDRGIYYILGDSFPDEANGCDITKIEFGEFLDLATSLI